MFCQKNVDEHATALLGLIEACGLLDHLFTRDEIVGPRKMVKWMTKDEKLGQQFSELLSLTVAAIEYAVAASVSV